ncbi:MAG: class I SAM-dependent methyltransferase, partial [Pedobacter sp.]
MFHQESYARHSEWYNLHFPGRVEKLNYYKQKKDAGRSTVASWLQQLFFDCLDPLLSREDSWLTVGDAYGFDAEYIIAKGSKALATDLSTDFLAVAKQQGIIQDFAAENAERLSFAGNQFDYVLSKESYHHFPRPYAAMYEMVRVARKGVVIIEPQDPVSKMPSLLFLTNMLASRTSLLNRAWKNRFSYEPVGNFVYKVSEREFEKFAAGLGLAMVAFKHINPNFYSAGTENMPAEDGNLRFLWI